MFLFNTEKFSIEKMPLKAFLFSNSNYWIIMETCSCAKARQSDEVWSAGVNATHSIFLYQMMDSIQLHQVVALAPENTRR